MKTPPRRPLAAALLLLSAASLAACTGGTPWAAFTGAAALLFFLPGLTGSARAGAPQPCEGATVETCANGRIRYNCCPMGSKCNFSRRPFVGCGNQLCVDGSDPSMCPTPTPKVIEGVQGAKACGDQYGSWEKACVAHKVQEACIMSVPTNYSGPLMNPPYHVCGDRCSTHQLKADCHPKRGEIADKACEGAWTKVCLGGDVQERCLDQPMSVSGGAATDRLRASYPSTEYIICPDKRCAIGTTSHAKHLCRRF